MPKWLDIEEAPRDGTVIRVRTMDGYKLKAKWVVDGFLDEDEKQCGGWVAEVEGEHPEDWTDGACWASNIDEVPSDPPREWQPIGENE